ncbi:hypothetical protein NQ314_005010 [Rhamnusium bicolor]|uniref:DDE Tnp4 domain-containing protein n=1 Tax=Rhamnusium bicolor TaxID=1586634 RepID=A0AAV8ZKC0_9CUCU|nr:hypothetical protein NQ314_005010 [Rhamnusium bicolor]
MNRWGFPGDVGAIDCTHVAILKPKADEHNFLNRNNFHSINTQIICDSDLKIRNIFASYGGATHDSSIWNQSAIKEFMQGVHANGERSWLIGDSGYPLSPFLMIPVREAEEDSPESRFNQAYARARNCIEICIGLLKIRFRCILKEITATPDFAVKLKKSLCNTA